MEYIEIIVNTFLIYFIILLVIRMLGKREIGEISIFDLVVLLLIADISTIGIQNNNILISICALVSLLILQKTLAFIVMKIPKLRRVLDGEYSLIVVNNKVNLKEMKKQRYTFDDLIAQSREKGIISLNEIELAILESNGELSVFKKGEVKSILPIIVSGEVDHEALAFLNITRDELNQEIKRLNSNLNNINYLSSDGKNFYTISDLID